MQKINSCNLCGAKLFQYLFSSVDWTFYKEKEKFNIVRCKNCGLIFLNPQPSKEELKTYYPDEYYLNYGRHKKSISFLERFRVNVVFRFKKKGRILDVGCQRGLFLKEFKDRGWEVYGVDISKISCRYAVEELNLKNIYCSDILDVEFPEKFFDVITLWHVIEHIKNPLTALKKLSAYLKDDGIIFIECPNVASFSNFFFKDKCPTLDTPRHLWFFSPTTLKRLLKKAGFITIKIDHFSQPFMNLVILRTSILRSLFLEKPINISKKISLDSESNLKKRNLFWIILRETFNFFCFFLSGIFAFFCRGEIIGVYAKLNSKN